NPKPQPNEIKIFYLDENEKSYKLLKLIESNKLKEFKVYKQIGQYFEIN
ncbi:1305_t:CDS:2, partial [Dentiscutata heterogama]